MSLLISPAFAEGAAPSGPAAGFDWILIVGMVVIFYFFLIRPQSKRAKEHRNLVEALARGEEGVPSGGILGKEIKVVDDFGGLGIANNRKIKVQKTAAPGTRRKGTIKGTELGCR